MVFTRSATDTNGNTYTTGYYQNTFSYGGLSTPVLANGITNFFLLKTDASGNALWLISSVSSSMPFVQGTAIAVDTAGGVYIGLQLTNGTLSLTTNAFSAGISFQLPPSTAISILAKYSQASGAIIYAKTDPTAASVIRGLVVTPDNASIIASGNFRGSGSFNGGAAITSFPTGADNLFLVKITASNGQTVWAAQARCATGGYDDENAVALDSSTNIYTIGTFGGTMFSGQPYQIMAYANTPANSSAFIVKWTNSASPFVAPVPQWAIASTDTSNSFTSANDLAVDVNSNLYVSFALARTDPNSTNAIGLNISGPNNATHYAQVNGGTSEGSIVKLDSNGNILWGEGTLGAVGSTNSNTRIAVTLNNVYSLGTVGPGVVTFDNSFSIETSGDSFIEQLSTNGAFGFVALVNGSGATPSLLPQDLIASTNASGDILNLVGTLAGSPGSNSFIDQYVLEPFRFEDDGSFVTITGYSGLGGAVAIPATILGLPVTAIGDLAFERNSLVRNITMDSNVTSIGAETFRECGLTNVVIGTGVITIGGQAFYDCGDLTNVTIPNNVATIGSQAFGLCADLTNVTIGTGVTNIDNEAFSECFSLTNITFLGNPPALGTLVFNSVAPSATVRYPNSAAGWGSTYGGLPTVPYEVFSYSTSGGMATITGYTGALGGITIPATNLQGQPIIGIAANAFAGNSNLTSVTLPGNITSLGDAAFQSCVNLTNLTFLGNSPGLSGSNVFTGVNAAAKVNFLTGTVGWGLTYGGLPTVLLPPPGVTGEDFQAGSVTSGGGNVVFTRAASDTNGNIYVTGYYVNTFSYDGLSATPLETGFTNAFVLKTDAVGNGLWLVSPATNSTPLTEGTAIGVDGTGGIYIGMLLSNSSTNVSTFAFPLGNHFNLLPLSAQSFVVKFTQASGAFVWEKIEGASNATNTTSVIRQLAVTGGNDAVIVAGNFRGSRSFGGTQLTASPTNADNLFLVKVNSTNGTTTWATQAISGTNGYNDLAAMALDGSNNIYTAGTFGGVMFNGRVYKLTAYSTNLSNSSAFIVRWSDPPAAGVGMPQWTIASTDTSNSFTSANDLAVDGNSNLYVSFSLARTDPNSTNVLGLNISGTGAGGSTHYAQTNGGASEGSIVKLDSNGNILWGQGTVGAAGSSNSSTRIAVTSNYVYSLGTFGPGAVTFGGVTTLTTRGDSFLVQLSNATGGLGLVVPMNPTGAIPSSVPQDLLASTGSLGDVVDAVGGLDGSPNSNSFVAQYAFGGSYVDLGGVGQVTVPSAILGLPVTSIGSNAFASDSSVASILIPAGITNIGDDAFEGCSDLTNIALPSGLTQIGNLSFAYCSNLTNILIPSAVTNLGDHSFQYCTALTNLLFLSNEPTLGGPDVFTGVNALKARVCYISGTTGWSNTFGGLKTVAISLAAIISSPTNQTVYTGGNVTFNVSASGTAPLGYQWYFGNVAINGATGSSYSLTNVTTDNAGNYYAVVTNNFSTATSSVAILTVLTQTFTFATNDGSVTISSYSGPGGAITIPDSVDGLPVTGIGVNAFNTNTIITSVIISSNVLNIGDEAFGGCTALTNIFIPNSVTNIGNSAFNGCSALVSVTGGSNVLSMGQYAFDGCSSLAGITLDTNLISVGAFGFYNCASLTNIVIPPSLTQISDVLFAGCSALTNITLPNTLASIGSYSFASCSSLTGIVIPNSVTNIVDYAFAQDTELTNIFVAGNPIPLGGPNVFTGLNPAISFVYYPASATGWPPTYGGLNTIAQVPFQYSVNGGTVTVGTYTGSGGPVTIPGVINGGPVTAIANNAFNGATNVTSVLLPTNITSIGDLAFDGCTNLGAINLPISITNIGIGAFLACSSLTNITLPTNLTSIAFAAFDGCSSLASLEIPGNVSGIGQNAFTGDLALTNIRLGTGVTNIGQEAFSYCTSLNSLTIPTNVTTLGATAFLNCTALQSVFFPGNAPAMPSDAFYYDTSTSLYYNSLTTGWGVFATETSAHVVVYNPQASGLTETSNQFGFTITGNTDMPVVVEAATDVAGPWTVLQSFTLTNGAVNFVDAQSASYPGRYYRFRSP